MRGGLDPLSAAREYRHTAREPARASSNLQAMTAQTAPHRQHRQPPNPTLLREHYADSRMGHRHGGAGNVVGSARVAAHHRQVRMAELQPRGLVAGSEH